MEDEPRDPTQITDPEELGRYRISNPVGYLKARNVARAANLRQLRDAFEAIAQAVEQDGYTFLDDPQVAFWVTSQGQQATQLATTFMADFEMSRAVARGETSVEEQVAQFAAQLAKIETPPDLAE